MIFISSQNIDEQSTKSLIDLLEAEGFLIEYSPRNPIFGEDEKWNNWYSSGIQKAVDRSEIFIISIDEGWDSSTWMMIEADEALKQFHNVKPLYYWNPSDVEIKSEGLKRVLQEELPKDLNEVIRTIRSKIMEM